jgi:anti-sigma regulatory factor (Ser/Thr protein kinase)
VNRTLSFRGAGQGGSVELTAYFPGDFSSVSAARMLVSDALQSWDAPVDLDAVRLATSEIVTNAVVHAGGVESITVRLTALVARVEVADHSRGALMAHAPAPDATSGRGLNMVALVTDRWGVDDLAGEGKAVWFTVTRADARPHIA